MPVWSFLYFRAWAMPNTYFWEFFLQNPRLVISRTLLLVGAPAGGNRSDLFREKDYAKIDEKKMSEDVAKTTQAVGIFSVLIATVTFASAFTLPGGYYQSASDGGVPGTPILAGSYAFRAFILADALAFICSCLSTFSLVFAGVPAMELSLRLRYTQISTMFLHASGVSLIASFALGLYLVLAPTAHATAITVCVISSGAFILGNMEVWQMFDGLNTARVRLGTRRLLLTWWDLAPAAICLFALLPFTSLIVIFGLPPITAYLNKTLSSLHAKTDILAGKILLLYVLAVVIILSSLLVVVSPPLIRLIQQRWKYYKTSGGLLALLGEM